MPAAQSRKPWPLKWIITAIIVFIVPYTFLTLHYRKPGPAYRPYEELRNRANTGRLLTAGYQRITLEAARPADPARAAERPGSAAATEQTLGGLPAALGDALVDQPLLPVSIDSVTAAAAAGAGQPYPIQFTCTLPDNKEQLAAALLYRRDDELVLVPSFEKLGGGLLARTRESTVLLTVPAGALRPGRYTVTLAGSRTARTWTLQVH